MIHVGAFLVPFVNDIADGLTGFKQTDSNVNESFGVYPGHEFCKRDQAHSLWHEVAANGLVDLIYLCDYTNYLI